MHRFFVPPQVIQGDQIALPPDVTHQLRHVLRLRPGDRIAVLDDQGFLYEVVLTVLTRWEATGQVVARRPAGGEPAIHITLYQAVLKGDRFEWVLQKGTELGVTAFVPVLAARCVIRNADDIMRKLPRWRRIIREAAEQSGRGRLPRLMEPMAFADVCQQAKTRWGLWLMAWEEEQNQGLKTVLAERNHQASGRIQLLTGPEGGFSETEALSAQACGIKSVTLGSRILRAETASIVAATIILYEFNQLG